MQHQVEGVAWLKERPRALLADEAGLGKSAQLLHSAVEPVLIVAPAMVLESGTWDDEIERWAPGINATQVSYSSIAQRGPRGTVPRDSNGFPLTPLKPEYSGAWGSAVLDEAQYIKGRKTSWANAIMDIHAPQIHCATGTPIPNWASEAYMLLKLMWPEQARAGHDLGSYWRWAKQWFKVEKDFFGALQVGDLLDHRTWEEFREANWGDRMIRRYRKDCLDLPPLTHQDWHVKMGTEQGKLYRQLKKDFVAWLESGEEISIWSEPGLLVKLMAVATGLNTLDRNAKFDGKLKALQTILSDREQQTLVVAHLRNSVDSCARVAESLGMRYGVVRGGIPSTQRKAAIRDFQQGRSQVLVASIQTIAEGLTLHQGGADLLVRVERSFTPTKNDQVDRRLHRMGVEKPIHTIDLITDGSTDERQLEILDGKTDQQMHALGDPDLRRLIGGR